MSCRALLRLLRPGHALIAACLALVACDVMRSTEQLEVFDGRCNSALGAYSLPKTHLRVVITQELNHAEPSDRKPYVLQSIDPVTRADETHTYCLDYLASPTSDDEVHVTRSVSIDVKVEGPDGVPKPDKRKVNTPYLQLISSDVVDVSSIIVRKLIHSIFIGLTQTANLQPASRALLEGKTNIYKIKELEFDPFDAGEVADVNNELRQFGFCVILENFSYDTRAAGHNHYCNDPRRIARVHRAATETMITDYRGRKSVQVRGIYYRPKAAYSLAIFVKGDPDGPGSWKLGKLQKVELENVSPILALGIERAVFAERRTALIFDNGILEKVCIAKGSEIEGAIEIPIAVINSLISLPTQLLLARINSADLNTQVINKEREVIEAQTALIKYKTNPESSPAPGGKPVAAALKLNDLTPQVDGKSGPVDVDEFFNQQEPTARVKAGTALSDICDKLGGVNFKGFGDGT